MLGFGKKNKAETLVDQPVEEKKESIFDRLKSQLSRTRSGLTGDLGNLFLGKKQIDDDLLEELEMILLSADVGMEATQHIIGQLTERVARKQLSDPQALTAALHQEMLAILELNQQPLTIPKTDRPFVILVVGVNGMGKTTTIGKLAKRLQAEGKSVMLAAGDTFRAAAIEQLQEWGKRNDIDVVAQHTGADSASVIYDAFEKARARNIDVLLADTAGRLHTQTNLMNELSKINRVIKKIDDNAPHEVMLVIDSGTGQNALAQTKHFNEATPLTGITLTKLDGTAKGGIIFAIAKQFNLPIRFIGIGEGIDDLREFNAQDFTQALFEQPNEAD
ncbi:MAG: signal recognition particle-docking protein FtsY [Cycloclasticus sp.]|nr:MAG: signal recognition particle-docking protein FtsY [Cycloclasticus sp.]